MIEPFPNKQQTSFLVPNFMDQLNPKHPLLKLVETIPWDYFFAGFAPLYSLVGRPAKRIRLMVGLCTFRNLKNLSDEALVMRWVQKPYYQSFCGETEFQWKFLYDPSDLVYFRMRIGEKVLKKYWPLPS